MDETKERIISTLEKIRPYLISDGGNLEFVKYEDNIVYIRLSGACRGCSMADVTIKNGIREILINDVPEIKDVINLD